MRGHRIVERSRSGQSAQNPLRHVSRHHRSSHLGLVYAVRRYDMHRYRRWLSDWAREKKRILTHIGRRRYTGRYQIGGTVILLASPTCHDGVIGARKTGCSAKRDSDTGSAATRSRPHPGEQRPVESVPGPRGSGSAARSGSVFRALPPGSRPCLVPSGRSVSEAREPGRASRPVVRA